MSSSPTMKLGSLHTPWSMATSRQPPWVNIRFMRALELMRIGYSFVSQWRESRVGGTPW